MNKPWLINCGGSPNSLPVVPVDHLGLVSQNDTDEYEETYFRKLRETLFCCNSSHLVPLSCAQTDVVSAWPLIEWTHVPREICNSCNLVAAMTSCGCDETEKGRSTVHHCLRHSRVEKKRKKKRKQSQNKHRPHRKSRHVGICRRVAGRRLKNIASTVKERDVKC